MLSVIHFRFKLWLYFSSWKEIPFLKRIRYVKALHSVLEKRHNYLTLRKGMVRSWLPSFLLIKSWLTATITWLIFNPDITKKVWVNVFSALSQISGLGPFDQVTWISNNSINCLCPRSAPATISWCSELRTLLQKQQLKQVQAGGTQRKAQHIDLFSSCKKGSGPAAA